MAAMGVVAASTVAAREDSRLGGEHGGGGQRGGWCSGEGLLSGGRGKAGAVKAGVAKAGAAEVSAAEASAVEVSAEARHGSGVMCGCTISPAQGRATACILPASRSSLSPSGWLCLATSVLSARLAMCRA